MADYHDTGHKRERSLLQKTTVPGCLLLSQRYSHTRVMPNTAAKKANKPSATRWPADEDEDELDFGALEELDEVGTGVPVGTAPTPVVIGPLSVV
jgi:hypothetical protein